MGAKDAKETIGNIKSFSLEGSSGDEYFDKRCGLGTLAHHWQWHDIDLRTDIIGVFLQLASCLATVFRCVERLGF